MSMLQDMVGVFGWIAFAISISIAAVRIIDCKNELGSGAFVAGAIASIIALVANSAKLSFEGHNTGSIATSMIVTGLFTFCYIIAFAEAYAAEAVAKKSKDDIPASAP
jgi:hypothetical protein